MRFTSTHCDNREHGMCDGTCVYMDQDGPQRLVCECGCHSKVREARRKDEALRKVQRLLRDERIDHLYRIVPTEGAQP